MPKILELVGGPPASGKSTYVREKYGRLSSDVFGHLDFDAMVVREAKCATGVINPDDVRERAGMDYCAERSRFLWGGISRVTVDWPFCVSKRAEEYMKMGRDADREIECNFFTVHATEAWKRSLTRHVAGEFNAFTVFLNKNDDVGVALKPSFRMFLEAHRDMPSAIERIFPQADRAFLWDNNARDSEPILIARCVKGGEIEVLDKARWDRFQYKREINIDADYQVVARHTEESHGVERELFDIRFVNLINLGKENPEYAMGF